MSEQKPREFYILDACCGSRMFWFNKEHPNVIFQDIRREDLDLNHGNRTCHIRPDKLQDFRKMDFPDNTFYLVVFDPPHLLNAGKTGYMAKKYGSLDKNWRIDLKQGFDECMRVLKPNGTLIFKWNESSIKVSEVIKIFGSEPLFGHKTLQKSKTIWLAFMKIQKPEQSQLLIEALKLKNSLESIDIAFHSKEHIDCPGCFANEALAQWNKYRGEK